MASINLNLGFSGNITSPGHKFKDIRLTLKKSPDLRGMRVLLDDNAIFNGIRNILSWRRGWRVLQPEFGNGLHQFLYQPINDITAKNIGVEINDMLERWEPRITVNQVTVVPVPDDHVFHISLEYTIPSFPERKIYNYSTTLTQE